MKTSKKQLLATAAIVLALSCGNISAFASGNTSKPKTDAAAISLSSKAEKKQAEAAEKAAKEQA
ncbi:MAG: hypothetical protein Q4G33_04905, partial [bacterium]|nr:hypothetical protein [bacterium]